LVSVTRRLDVVDVVHVASQRVALSTLRLSFDQSFDTVAINLGVHGREEILVRPLEV